jgi:hypothetical protein
MLSMEESIGKESFVRMADAFVDLKTAGHCRTSLWDHQTEMGFLLHHNKKMHKTGKCRSGADVCCLQHSSDHQYSWEK